MKTFYNLLYADESQTNFDNLFHFNINDNVRKAFAQIKDVMIDLSLFVVGFVAIVWIFGMVAGL